MSDRIVTEALIEDPLDAREDYAYVCIPVEMQAYVDAGKLWLGDKNVAVVNPWRSVIPGESTNGWWTIKTESVVPAS